MEEQKTNQIVDENNVNTEVLPLSIREHLMRGNQTLAIEELQKNHGKSETEATQLIEDYRDELRERKLELDIQMMNAENKRDAHAMTRKIITWGAYLVILLLIVFILNLVLNIQVKQ